MGLSAMSAMGGEDAERCEYAECCSETICLLFQLIKADDKILDCCVHFAKFDQHQAAVWLWTDDRNLKVQVGSAFHRLLADLVG